MALLLLNEFDQLAVAVLLLLAAALPRPSACARPRLLRLLPLLSSASTSKFNWRLLPGPASVWSWAHVGAVSPMPISRPDAISVFFRMFTLLHVIRRPGGGVNHR